MPKHPDHSADKEAASTEPERACNPSLVPRLPRSYQCCMQRKREPGKIYYVCDIGIKATWSAARANHDSALYDGSRNHKWYTIRVYQLSLFWLDHLGASFTKCRTTCNTPHLGSMNCSGNSRTVIVPRTNNYPNLAQCSVKGDLFAEQSLVLSDRQTFTVTKLASKSAE